MFHILNSITDGMRIWVSLSKETFVSFFVSHLFHNTNKVKVNEKILFLMPHIHLYRMNRHFALISVVSPTIFLSLCRFYLILHFSLFFFHLLFVLYCLHAPHNIRWSVESLENFLFKSIDANISFFFLFHIDHCKSAKDTFANRK